MAYEHPRATDHEHPLAADYESPTPPMDRPRVNALVVKLKEADQDFEFYPTTPEIIACIIKHHKSTLSKYDGFKGSVLDIGAGHGAFLKAFKDKHPGCNLLAIEKSPILMSELVKVAKVVGTDFHSQSFTSKTANLTFSNPPYSEYETWTTRLIRECPSEDMYLVIPERWKDNDKITEAIKFRESKVKVIGSFDFEDAERRARAKVDVLHIRSTIGGDKLFEKFFFERFKHLKDDETDEARDKRHEKEHKESETRRAGLVQREGLIGALVALYDLEMDHLQSNYDKAAGLDPAVLGALGLMVNTIVTSLREKLNTLKDQYWSELFSNLDSITKRLTTKNRRAIMETIGGFKAVDFTKDNIYAVLLWVIEHANSYVDSQILAVFDDMLSHACMHNYTSNKKVYEKGRYRYQDEKPTHVSLDFRIVIESNWRGISRSYGSEGLSEGGANLLKDIHTVATLLGIECATDDARLNEGMICKRGGHTGTWKPGGAQLFKTLNGDDLVEARAFINGNMHLRLSQKFCLALNVAVGKLRGWIRNHEEATTEWGEGAAEEFAKDHHITPKQIMLTMTPKDTK